MSIFKKWIPFMRNTFYEDMPHIMINCGETKSNHTWYIQPCFVFCNKKENKSVLITQKTSPKVVIISETHCIVCGLICFDHWNTWNYLYRYKFMKVIWVLMIIYLNIQSPILHYELFVCWAIIDIFKIYIVIV